MNDIVLGVFANLGIHLDPDFSFFPTCGFFRCIWLYIQLHFKSIDFGCSCNAQYFCKSDPKISTEAPENEKYVNNGQM